MRGRCWFKGCESPITVLVRLNVGGRVDEVEVCRLHRAGIKTLWLPSSAPAPVEQPDACDAIELDELDELDQLGLLFDR